MKNEKKVKISGFENFYDEEDDKSVAREVAEESLPVESKDLINEDNLEKYLETSHINKEEENSALKDVDLSELYTYEILGFSELQPIVIYAKVGKTENETEELGIPGFFDKSNNIFLLLDGTPVKAKNFDEKFKKFLETLED